MRGKIDTQTPQSRVETTWAVTDDVPVELLHVENYFPRTRRDASLKYVPLHVDKSNNYIGNNQYYEDAGPVPASSDAVVKDGLENFNGVWVDNGVDAGCMDTSCDAAIIHCF